MATKTSRSLELANASALCIQGGDVPPTPEFTIRTTGLGYETGFEEFPTFVSMFGSAYPLSGDGMWAGGDNDSFSGFEPDVVAGGRPGSGSWMLRFTHIAGVSNTRIATYPLADIGNHYGTTFTGRFYLLVEEYVTGASAARFKLMSLGDLRIDIRRAGSNGAINLNFFTSQLTSGVLSAVSLTTGTWYRVEFSTINVSGSSTISQVRIYEGDSITVLETTDLTGNNNPLSGVVAFGNDVQSGTQHLIYSIDDVRVDGHATVSGPATIKTYIPTSDISIMWTPTGAATISAAIDDMASITPDDDTTCALSPVGAGTFPRIDRLSVIQTPLDTVEVPITYRSASIQIQSRRKGAGVIFTPRFWDSLGVAYLGPQSNFPNGFYRWTKRAESDVSNVSMGMIYALTSAMFPSQIEDIDIGYQQDSSDSNINRVTAQFMNVEYTIPS